MTSKENEIKNLEDEHDLFIKKLIDLGICGTQIKLANSLTEEVSKQWHGLDKERMKLRRKIDLLYQQ